MKILCFYFYNISFNIIFIFSVLPGGIIGFLPLMGWRGDTNDGAICWFIVISPPSLVLFTTIVGIAPVILIFILYGIILYIALKNVMLLKKASKNQSGVQTGNLRVFRGGGSTNVLDDPGQFSETEEPLKPKNRFLRFFMRLVNNFFIIFKTYVIIKTNLTGHKNQIQT